MANKVIGKERLIGCVIAGALALWLIYQIYFGVVIGYRVDEIALYKPEALTILRFYKIAAALLGGLIGLIIARFRLGWIFSIIIGFIAGVAVPIVSTIAYHLYSGTPFTYANTMEKYGGGLIFVLTFITAGFFYGLLGGLAGVTSRSYLRVTQSPDNESIEEDFQKPPAPPAF